MCLPRSVIFTNSLPHRTLRELCMRGGFVVSIAPFFHIPSVFHLPNLVHIWDPSIAGYLEKLEIHGAYKSKQTTHSHELLTLHELLSMFYFELFRGTLQTMAMFRILIGKFYCFLYPNKDDLAFWLLAYQITISLFITSLNQSFKENQLHGY